MQRVDRKIDFWNILPHFVQVDIILYWILTTPAKVRLMGGECYFADERKILTQKKQLLDNLYKNCKSLSMRYAISRVRKLCCIFFSEFSCSFYSFFHPLRTTKYVFSKEGFQDFLFSRVRERAQQITQKYFPVHFLVLRRINYSYLHGRKKILAVEYKYFNVLYDDDKIVLRESTRDGISPSFRQNRNLYISEVYNYSEITYQ